MKPIALKSVLVFLALCFLSSCHKDTVTPANTVSAASSTPTLLANTALTAITHNTTGATGIGDATGLPAGVAATWVANVITISGMPTECGRFNYIIPLAGGSGTATATGMIIVMCDYLPLNVGAKYLYSYSGILAYPGDYSSEDGDCQWEFIDRNSTPPYVYRVRQTLNGIHVIWDEDPSTSNDTTIIRNRIDTLTFQENENGTVTITFPVMYWKSGSETVERYLKSSQTDTCFTKNYIDRICLSKNIGIKSLLHHVSANHGVSTSYTWVKGPY